MDYKTPLTTNQTIATIKAANTNRRVERAIKQANRLTGKQAFKTTRPQPAFKLG